jgi:hypothetical protein
MAGAEYVKTTLEGSSDTMAFLRNCETASGMYTGAATDEAYQEFLGPYITDTMGQFMIGLDNGSIMMLTGDTNNLDPRVMFEPFCSTGDPAFLSVQAAISE